MYTLQTHQTEKVHTLGGFTQPPQSPRLPVDGADQLWGPLCAHVSPSRVTALPAVADGPDDPDEHEQEAGHHLNVPHDHPQADVAAAAPQEDLEDPRADQGEAHQRRPNAGHRPEMPACVHPCSFSLLLSPLSLPLSLSLSLSLCLSLTLSSLMGRDVNHLRWGESNCVKVCVKTYEFTRVTLYLGQSL